MRDRILLIDDDAGICRTISNILNDEGYEVIQSGDIQTGLNCLQQGGISLVLLDLRLPDGDGMNVLSEISSGADRPPVIIITAHADISKAVYAVKQGAFDFLAKPLDMNNLLITIRNAVEQNKLKKEITRLSQKAGSLHQMIGTSKAVKEIYALIGKIAPTNAGILITGPSGAGKELVANLIHDQSARKERELVKINCAAVPEALLESELFGYEKGAFTGATAAKKGKLEMADGGTLFLDEIGDMSLSTQSKLLRFLQDGELEKVGSVKHTKVDVRIIAATNKELAAEIREKRFREDLYYRLNEMPVKVPPLAERREDIPLLANYYLSLFCRENGLPEKLFSDTAMMALTNAGWPGNVRQLKNAVKRLILLKDRQILEGPDVMEIMGMETGNDCISDDEMDLRSARGAFEKNHIINVLTKCEGNMTKAAEALGIERSNLYRKVEMYGIGKCAQ